MADYETFSGGEFPFPVTKQFISEVIAYWSGKNVTTAKITAIAVDNGKGYGLFLSNNDGSTWENAVNGTEHIFSTTGEKLRYRIVGEQGCIIQAPVRVDYTLS